MGEEVARGGGDVAGVVARFGEALREAGVPAGADRCERFARAVMLVRPRSLRGLLEVAVATLASSREQAGTLTRVFEATFGGIDGVGSPAGRPGGAGRPDGRMDGDQAQLDTGVDTLARVARTAREHPVGPHLIQVREAWDQAGSAGDAAGKRAAGDAADGADAWGSARDAGAGGVAEDEGARGTDSAGGGGTGAAGETDAAGGPGSGLRGVASATERLAGTDFGELTAAELLQLASTMRRLTLAVPMRRSHRQRRGARGRQADLRATLRHARRSGAYPFGIIKKIPSRRPRKLVVLCDISGSMEPYARAMLQLLYCAAGGARAEVFSFATRLTRLTRALAEPEPGLALQRAGQAAPDWLGGTRIGVSLKEFNDSFGIRGLARGAVVVVVSDGWDTGDPVVVRREMERLSRVAFRIVWVNPRSQSPGYLPLAGGMAAAWPYCDAVVSAHRLDALGELTAALADPVRRRTRSGATTLPV